MRKNCIPLPFCEAFDSSNYRKAKKEMMSGKHARNNALIIFLLAVCFCGCGAIDVARYPDGANFVRDERLTRPETLPEVSFSIINTADFEGPAWYFNTEGGLFGRITSVVPVYLVKHPKGMFLFDGGFGDNVKRDYAESAPLLARYLVAPWFMPFRPKESARAQLQKSGIVDPESIKTMIIGHSHFDHTGGVQDFPWAEIWIDQKDYNYALAKAGWGFSVSTFADSKVKWRFLKYEDKPYENFDRSLDWFGDGSVVLVPLPGHTPGETGMFINTRSGKRYFLVNDSVYYSQNAAIPASLWFVKNFINRDKKETEATIVRIHRLMKHSPEIIVISSHDDLKRIAEVAAGMAFPNFIK
jgi:glyoxylase-like metal-dependent hydrolase (beta-lactamase superfamily II)